jgi:DNA-binding NarL/FixJ family response regulator
LGERSDVTTRILLVEDYAPDVVAIRALLGDRFGVMEEASVSAALERLAREGADLVLLDLKVRDSQGLDGLTRILASHPELPVIVLTSLSDRAFATQALAAGAKDYIVKGTVDAQLLSRSILRHARRGGDGRG